MEHNVLTIPQFIFLILLNTFVFSSVASQMDPDYRVSKFLSLLRDEGAWVQPLCANHFVFHCPSLPFISLNFTFCLSSSPFFMFFSFCFLCQYFAIHMYMIRISHVFVLTVPNKGWIVQTSSERLLTSVVLFCTYQVKWRRPNPNLRCCCVTLLCTGKINNEVIWLELVDYVVY